MYLVKLQTGLTFTSKDICSLCTFYKEKERNHSIRLVTSSIASSIFCLCLSGCVLPLLLPSIPTPWKDGGQMGGTGVGRQCFVLNVSLPSRRIVPNPSPHPLLCSWKALKRSQRRQTILFTIGAFLAWCQQSQGFVQMRGWGLSSFLWLSVISICNLWETK